MKHYLTHFEETIKDRWNQASLTNYEADSYTYGEVATHMAKFHLFFEDIKLEKGDKIALYAKNTARWGISFFAINTFEAVVVPILIDFLPENAAGLVDHSDSKVLFTDTDAWEKMDIALMPQIQAVISVTDFTLLYAATDEIKAAMDNLHLTFQAKYPMGFTRDNVKYPTNNDKNLAIINYTSGTTSAPKGVMVRYESVSSNVDYALNKLPVEKGDTQVSMLPMAHMYGLMFELIYPFCGGSTITYLGKTPTPAVLLGAMADVKPTLVVTVPLVMEKIFKGKLLPVLNKPVMKVLTNIPGINTIIFKKIKTQLLTAFGGRARAIVMGGAALNPTVEKWFKKFKLPYTVGYGMTEMAPLLAYESWDEFAPKSCGRIVTNMEVRINSDDPQREVGEIQTKGVNVMSGYFKNEEATKAAFTEDGWMRTGDLGVIDAKGNIFIKGRSKNMLLSSNGQNIYPEEIEAMLNNQDYVVESVVVQRAHKLVGLVYLDAAKIKVDKLDGEDISDKMVDMKNLVNKDLPNYSKLAQIEVVEEPFAKTPKMSIKRFMYK